MKLCLWIDYWYVLCDVVIENPFAEIICLNCRFSSSSTFPIDFVKIVREQNHTTHNTLSLSSLGHVFDPTKEELEIGMHRRRIIALGKGEFGSVRTVIDIFIVCKSPIARLGFDFGEVNEI